jgi:hypothetical protein
MCLRFVFLLIRRAPSWLRLSQREEAWKTAEILILRHQLAVLQRRQPRPKLNWADRALLTTLLSVIPKARHQGLRLLVTPDTILRWHRNIVRRRWAARSMHGKAGRPATRRNIRALVLRLARENPDLRCDAFDTEEEVWEFLAAPTGRWSADPHRGKCRRRGSAVPSQPPRRMVSSAALPRAIAVRVAGDGGHAAGSGGRGTGGMAAAAWPTQLAEPGLSAGLLTRWWRAAGGFLGSDRGRHGDKPRPAR